MLCVLYIKGIVIRDRQMRTRVNILDARISFNRFKMEPSSYYTWFFNGRENEPRDRLTFGIELAFAVAVIPQNQKLDPDENDPRAGKGIDTGVDPNQIWLDSRRHIVKLQYTSKSRNTSAEASLH